MKYLVSLLLCWFVVNASAGRVVDGDTFDVTVKIWHNVTVSERVRLLGVDTPERSTAEGLASKIFTEAWLAQGSFDISSCKRDSFGRVLARVTRGVDDLSDVLIRNGHGVPR